MITKRPIRFGVLGGGFGLYGWIPAIAMLPDTQITTLQKYRDRLESRKELQDLAKRIHFANELDEILDRSDHIIVARRPKDQVEFIENLARKGWQGSIVVEKPLAPSPIQALSLLKTLTHANIRVAAGFSMTKTSWASTLGSFLSNGSARRIQINWNFMAHHYRHSLRNWKRQPTEGGGALRFYSIHLIAWLAQVGMWEPVECSPLSPDGDDPAVTFSVRHGETLIDVQCNSSWSGKPNFSIQAERGQNILFNTSLNDPFEERQSNVENAAFSTDRRVPYLFALLNDLSLQQGTAARNLEDHIWLWKKIEARRRCCH